MTEAKPKNFVVSQFLKELNKEKIKKLKKDSLKTLDGFAYGTFKNTSESRFKVIIDDGNPQPMQRYVDFKRQGKDKPRKFLSTLVKQLERIFIFPPKRYLRPITLSIRQIFKVENPKQNSLNIWFLNSEAIRKIPFDYKPNIGKQDFLDYSDDIGVPPLLFIDSSKNKIKKPFFLSLIFEHLEECEYMFKWFRNSLDILKKTHEKITETKMSNDKSQFKYLQKDSFEKDKTSFYPIPFTEKRLDYILDPNTEEECEKDDPEKEKEEKEPFYKICPHFWNYEQKMDWLERLYVGTNEMLPQKLVTHLEHENLMDEVKRMMKKYTIHQLFIISSIIRLIDFFPGLYRFISKKRYAHLEKHLVSNRRVFQDRFLLGRLRLELSYFHTSKKTKTKEKQKQSKKKVEEEEEEEEEIEGEEEKKMKNNNNNNISNEVLDEIMIYLRSPEYIQTRKNDKEEYSNMMLLFPKQNRHEIDFSSRYNMSLSIVLEKKIKHQVEVINNGTQQGYFPLSRMEKGIYGSERYLWDIEENVDDIISHLIFHNSLKNFLVNNMSGVFLRFEREMMEIKFGLVIKTPENQNAKEIFKSYITQRSRIDPNDWKREVLDVFNNEVFQNSIFGDVNKRRKVIPIQELVGIVKFFYEWNMLRIQKGVKKYDGKSENYDFLFDEFWELHEQMTNGFYDLDRRYRIRNEFIFPLLSERLFSFNNESRKYPLANQRLMEFKVKLGLGKIGKQKNPNYFDRSYPLKLVRKFSQFAIDPPFQKFGDSHSTISLGLGLNLGWFNNGVLEVSNGKYFAVNGNVEYSVFPELLIPLVLNLDTFLNSFVYKLARKIVHINQFCTVGEELEPIPMRPEKKFDNYNRLPHEVSMDFISFFDRNKNYYDEKFWKDTFLTNNEKTLSVDRKESIFYYKYFSNFLENFRGKLQEYERKDERIGDRLQVLRITPDFLEKFPIIRGRFELIGKEYSIFRRGYKYYEITFLSHTEVDDFYLSVLKIDPFFRRSYKDIYQLLRGFDNAYWYHLSGYHRYNLKDSPAAQKYKGCVDPKTGEGRCPFKNESV